MVWLFILLTAITYSFVMKYVLNHIQKPVKVMNTVNPLENEHIEELASLHQSGKEPGYFFCHKKSLA